jgi:hypothetical protein
MTRKQALILLLVSALLALALNASVAKKHVLFTDTIKGQFGVQHMNGPGDYEFNEGAALTLVVTDTTKLTKVLGIKGLKNGEHILLQHIKDDRFEVRHQPSGQKAALQLTLSKGGK